MAKMTRQRNAAVRRAKTPGPEASIGKLALTQNYMRLAALVSVVLGVPGYRLGGGTDEVLKNGLAERVLGMPKEPSATAQGGR